MKKLVFLFFAAVLAVYIFPSSLAAQSQFGQVSGTVLDPKGLAVPDAKVTLTSVATGVQQLSASNKDGLYVVDNVAPGDYDLTVEKENFRKSTLRLTVGVAEHVTANITLQIGAVSETVTVTAGANAINTENPELGSDITQAQLQDLPLITRNPYGLFGLTAGAADTGTVTGDTRGLGFSVSGSRTSDVNFMLDGGENNDTFVAGVGQSVPLDAVQEFKVQTHDMSAEYGRNPVVTNLITKAGTNDFHGGASEYYRGSGISAIPFDDNAHGRNPDGSRVVPIEKFVRNQFGGTIGGPIRKDKTFFFVSFEGVRVRSAGSSAFFVPTVDFIANSSAATANFVNTFGGPPASKCATGAESAFDIHDRIEGNAGIPQTNVITGNPIAGTTMGYNVASVQFPGNVFGEFPGGTALQPDGSGPPASLIGGPTGATNLFCRTALASPTDNGGGFPQNTWRWTAKIDHNFTANTHLTGSYAFENEKFPTGFISFGPFGNFFNTGERDRNQNANVTLTHTFSPRFFSDSRLVYNRRFQFQPEAGPGQAPSSTPCWEYGGLSSEQFATVTGDPFTLPGYVPPVCAFAGIPFGGPQNIYQANENMTYVLGKHTIKWGGGYLHLRDNRTFGAYENGFADSESMQNILNGSIDFSETAIDPQGLVPGQKYDPAVLGPFGPPSFTRHFHYNEVSTYVQDSYKATSRLTVDAGLRWEYFGVLHSPTAERLLDANLFLGAVGSFAANQNIFQSVADARFQRTNNLYQQDWKDFGPRVGFAYDVFGNGKTVFRAGYGIFFDRNFGNAVFNVIQNPPNYAVLFEGNFVGTAQTIDPNQFNTLATLGATPVRSSARMLNRTLKTAYVEQWNATIEHDLFGKGIITSLSYVGTNGIRLYSLNNLNNLGSCILDPTANAVCDPSLASGSKLSRLNQTGLTGMNRRGNEGLSRYNGLQFDVRTREIGHTGITARGNYTWSHSLDNESSFFADSPFEGFFGFGFRDPYKPALDRSNSANDIRHRLTMNAVWEVPWFKNARGVTGEALGGWSFSDVFVAETGGAFSVFDGSGGGSDCGNGGTNFCLPVVTGPVPHATSNSPSPTSPNTFNLYTITNATYLSQADFCTTANVTGQLGLGCTAALTYLFPQLLASPHAFRTPGFYNWDMSIIKSFHLPVERMGLQIRMDMFDVLNHANLFAVPGTNAFSPGIGTVSTVSAARGCFPGFGKCVAGKERRNLQLGVKFTF